MKFDYVFWGYPSGITDNTTIVQAANLLQTDLRNVIVDRGYKSIALVSHSMGGLVARQFILNNAIQNNNEILDRITLVMNIATPHLGTNVANLASLVLKHSNVNNMGAFSEYLQKTSENWKHLIEHQSVWTGLFVVVAGTEDDVVPYGSVRQQYNQVESLPYGHRDITRVDDANHGFYRLLLRKL